MTFADRSTGLAGVGSESQRIGAAPARRPWILVLKGNSSDLSPAHTKGFDS